MKRSIVALAMAGLFVVATSVEANPGMSSSSKPAPKSPPSSYHPRHNPPPRILPPLRVAPPIAIAPPAFVPPVAPAAPVSPVVLTNGAWIAQNPMTGMYSVAFDSPGVSGLSILVGAGYSVVVRGPTNWLDATAYLKSIGAPGW